jgi:hypothetical protein
MELPRGTCVLPKEAISLEPAIFLGFADKFRNIYPHFASYKGKVNLDGGPSSREEEETMTDIQKSQIEQFPVADLNGLRDELRRSSLDSWQSADLISSFLSGRGYGVSTDAARIAASRIESFSSLQSMQEELEKLALVM